MKNTLFAAVALAALPLGHAAAQTPVSIQTVSGTRLDLSVTGEVSRVPDVAIISAGVVTRAPTAAAAVRANATRMERVLAALKRAGVEERDIQTSSINLNPDYRYREGAAPQITGYSASNQVNVRFRDIENSGAILDALVAEGANQINGPSLTIDKPETALDEARTRALAAGRARADLYAHALGRRVVRLISVSEGGGQHFPQPPMVVQMEARAAMGAADTKIVPGEQQVQINLAMSFELQ